VFSGFTEAGILAVLAEVAVNLVNGAKRLHAKIGPLQVHSTVGVLIGVAFALVVIRMALQVPLSILPARIASSVQARLRRDVFGAFTRASWEVQSREREGHLQEIMTSQVLQATGGALQATGLVTAGFSFLVLVASAFALNVLAAVFVMTAATLLFVLLRPLNSLGVRQARALSQAQMDYAGGIGEASRMAEDTQVFGVDGAQRGRIERLVVTAQDLFFRTQMIGRLVPNIYSTMIYLILVAGLAILYEIGKSHVAALGAVVLLLVRAGTYGQSLQTSYQGLRQSLPFIERLQETARRFTESSPIHGHRPLSELRTLAFQDVCFAYRAGNPVLSCISFEMTGGEAIGIVGPSGAGKSTLVQLLLQLRTPDSGRYLVNGVPVEEFSREDWHRRVAYVPQEPRLVHATVAENIRYFRDLDDEAIERAGRLARIHDEVMAWPDGYQTVVGPRADAVSGGQQQRICVARAIAARPGVLVLDEPTSALDPYSETLIQESLMALKDELTLFIIAHRMSTLNMCDRVMVVVDGRLQAFDSKALLERDNAYYRSASMLAVGSSANGSH
jgi:ATP-binding cassette, subfamily B, bacterial